MPHRTRGISKHRRVPNAPCPEEPILQGIHIGLDVGLHTGFSVSGPVEPFFPFCAVACSRSLVGCLRVDAIKPFTAVVDSRGPFAAQNDTEGSLGVVGASAPAACLSGLLRPCVVVLSSESEVWMLIKCNSIGTGQEPIPCCDTGETLVNGDHWAVAGSESGDAADHGVGLVVAAISLVL